MPPRKSILGAFLALALPWATPGESLPLDPGGDRPDSVQALELPAGGPGAPRLRLDRELEPGTPWKSPYGEEIQLFALERGTQTAWQDAAVDVRQAYHDPFGRNPPRPVAVGLMTDSDNHCGHARAWIEDIRFTAPE